MESIWTRTTLPVHPPLEGRHRCDAVVLGGGMAGILTAWFLRQHGLSVIVLEANRVGSGQTQNTTAKITAQHGLCYAKLIDRFGDPPGAVNALIHVALLRGEAGRAGISDISQKGNMLYFKVENFDMETLSALYAQKEFKNRVKLEAGREPRLGLKLRPGARPIPEARALVEAWNKLQKPAAEPAAEKE